VLSTGRLLVARGCHSIMGKYREDGEGENADQRREALSHS
jgi:hypothetical protein